MSQIVPIGEKTCSGHEISGGQTDHYKAPAARGPNNTFNVHGPLYLKCYYTMIR